MGHPSLTHEDDFNDLLEELVDQETMTIIVGAGSSVESGLPDWPSLLEELLREVGRRHGLRKDDLEAFCQWTMQRDHLTGAGAIVKSELGEEFATQLRSALYGDTSQLAPGPTALAAARLRLTLPGKASELVTTNYDTLLEDALDGELRRIGKVGEVALQSLAHEDPQAADEVAVRHVHGLLPPTGEPGGTVVLSEGDYHLMQDEESWQEQYFRERLSSSTCVFVGTSLTDPNLLRYLYRTGSDRQHVAIFARQQDASLYLDAPSSVSTARETTVRGRWEALGVRPVLVEHFGQAAQVLFELAMKRSRRGDYVPFEHRLDDWDTRISRTVLSTGRDFSERQDGLQSILRSLVDGAHDTLKAEGSRLARGERLQMSVWAYRPKQETLLNWASSDRAWRDPRTLEPVPIDWRSGFAAVRAFCNGSVISFSTMGQTATRWNHVVAGPVYLDEEDEFGRLPVGVVTLASTHPENRSVLGRQLPVVRRTVIPKLTDRAGRLLRPEEEE